MSGTADHTEDDDGDRPGSYLRVNLAFTLAVFLIGIVSLAVSGCVSTPVDPVALEKIAPVLNEPVPDLPRIPPREQETKWDVRAKHYAVIYTQYSALADRHRHLQAYVRALGVAEAKPTPKPTGSKP